MKKKKFQIRKIYMDKGRKYYFKKHAKKKTEMQKK